ncbi:M90 family metallopeptidase [Propionivibrio sp.]|uniref:M90 family metallopeptidase n=1 Tax=Propionivibrio sp. TaxID=2212460 RepID=UPI0026101585|nr:M90 family metallopeptidase [Propionivibrio sp.]
MTIGKLIHWLRESNQPHPLPDALWEATLATLPFVDPLDREEKSRLRKLSKAFLAEKEFTSAGGLELSDVICVSIAVQGCLPILNLGLERYRDWVGIIVYPDEFIIPRSVEDEFGIVHEYNDIASGEAWEGGPLLVSWRDAQMAGSGYNVVIHEFAHKLDMQSGEANGIPPLPANVSRTEWEAALLAAYDNFCARVDVAEENGEDFYATSLLDPYAAENPGEFFAVMSETFFETPDILRQAYPTLYVQMSRFYRQDPAARSDGVR